MFVADFYPYVGCIPSWGLIKMNVHQSSNLPDYYGCKHIYALDASYRGD